MQGHTGRGLGLLESGDERRDADRGLIERVNVGAAVLSTV